jgi:hypothetical protein
VGTPVSRVHGIFFANPIAVSADQLPDLASAVPLARPRRAMIIGNIFAFLLERCSVLNYKCFLATTETGVE